MSDDPITDALLAIFRKVTLNEGVCSTDQFFEAGGTSLGIFQVLAEIESVFGVTLQYADIYKDITAKNLAQMIHRAKHPYISSLNQTDAIHEHTELVLSTIGFSTLTHSNSNAVLVTGAKVLRYIICIRKGLSQKSSRQKHAQKIRSQVTLESRFLLVLHRKHAVKNVYATGPFDKLSYAVATARLSFV